MSVEVHPTAMVDKAAQLGDGVKIGPYATIGANVKLTDSTYLWADVERTEGADIEEEWRGTVGVRFSF